MKRKYIQMLVLLALLAGNTRSLHGQDKKFNYVHSVTMLDKEGTNCLETTQYYSAYGIPERTVQHRFAPGGKDLVTSEERNIYGVQLRAWLPVAINASNTSRESTCATKASNFYGDSDPYTLTVYESCTGGRIRKQYGAGELWINSEKAITTNYLTNTSSGNLLCRRYSIQDMGDDNFVLKQNGVYGNATLEVTETIDEDGNKNYKFTDYRGQLLLIRQMEGDTPYDTYYLYTLSGKVQAVVPPALSDATANNGEYNLSSIRKYAYLYRYDHRDRLVEKWIPGSTASVRYIYDKADRPVLTQNANQRVNNQWTLTKYDVHGRPLLTGILTTAESFDSLAAGIGSQTVTETYNGNQTSGSYGYTQTFSPGAIEVLSVIYYDDYRFLEQDNHFISYTVNALSGDYYRTPKGQITGEIIFTEGDASRKRFVTHFYNNRGWEVQNNSHDSTGFTDKSYTEYDFVGNRLQMKHTHVGADTSLEELYTYVYDHGNRLVQVKHKLGNSPEVILTSNEYDEVCRLQCTRMNNGTISSEYEYNIRNWLTKINNPLFTQTLHYTDGMGTPYYGGNISSMTWKVNNGAEQGYKFTYDRMSRLQDAIYGEGSTLALNPNRFNEQITGYDKMGNILGIKRFGQTSSNGFGLIDDLTLSYNGNQLQSVSDKVSSSVYGNGFDFKDGATKDLEYEYDENGNMTKDLNKKILRIEYNSINLPCRIEFANGHIVSNVYDAGGTKLRTVHVMGNESTVTDYCGNVIYEDGEPVKLLTEAGYVTLSDHKYHYFIQDHQGNNRVVVDQNGTVEEVNHYYPFGGLMSSSVGNAVQPYKYNGKELDRKNGLDWYDYGARMYDAALGRWHAVDPMSDKFYVWSPYVYCKNDPLSRIDIDGMYDYTVNNNGKLFRNGEKGNDRLFSTNKDVKPISISDESFLAGMYKMQSDYKNPSKEFYNATTNIKDAASVFLFVADNTSVEWKLDAYQKDDVITAILGTKHRENEVFADRQKELLVEGEKVFDSHSHPYNKVASDNDMKFLKTKVGTIYHKDSKTLFFYDKDNQRINNGMFQDRRIETENDLYNFLHEYLNIEK